MHPKIDFFVGLFLIAFAAVGYYMAGLLPTAPKGLGPGDYPKVILGILFILGIILTGYAFYQMKKMTGKAKSSYEKGEIKLVILLVACVALYIKLQAYLGFIVSTPIFMFIMMYLFSMREWLKMALISIVTTAVVYILFNNFLYVLLPRFNLF